MNCPQCGANMIYKDRMIVCEFCGYEEKDPTEFKDYNLLISCPPGPDRPIKVEIPDSNIAFTTQTGESRSFTLSEGPHDIIITAGKHKNRRRIFIIDNFHFVKVSVSYDAVSEGSLYLLIDQPDTNGRYPKLTNGKLPASESKLSIFNMFLSMTFFASFIAVIIAIVDIVRSKREGRELNALSVAAIVIGTATTLAFIGILVFD